LKPVSLAGQSTAGMPLDSALVPQQPDLSNEAIDELSAIESMISRCARKKDSIASVASGPLASV
jgi:hypothetical protein